MQVTLNESRTETIVYNKTNVLPGSTATAFNPRDTTLRVMMFPHFNQGIFEQGIFFRNTMDAALNVTIRVSLDWKDGTGSKNGAQLWQGSIPNDARFSFVSDKSTSVVETATGKVINLIELRLPYPQISFEVQAATIPTTGEILIMSLRRY